MVCAPMDVGCQLLALVTPYIFLIVVVLVLIFVIPKAGPKGVFVAIVGIFMILWWYGLVPFLPALGRFFGG